MTAIQEVRRVQTVVDIVPTQQSKETRTNWLRWITDPDIRQWMCGPLPTNPEEVYHWVDSVTTDPRRHYFDIRQDNKPVGFISIREDHTPGNTGEIGIVIGEKQYQSRGIGTRALDQLLHYAQHTIHLTSVRALIKPDNEKSIKLFIRSGFIHTADVTIDGTPMLKFEKTLT